MNKLLKLAIYSFVLIAIYRGAKVLTVTDNSESDVLARTIWGEARGEGYAGMQAVANVIMNRVKRGGWYGLTVSEVCKKPYQFSCWNVTDPNYQKIKTVTTANNQFLQAVEIATQAVNGTLPDITSGATEYHATSIKPNWNYNKLVEVGTIGNHKFYRSIA